VIGLVVVGAEAQPTMTMCLAEAEWYVVRQEVLPRFEAVGNCRVRAIDVLPETLVQRLRAMHQAGRMEIDLLAQDNTHLQELVNTALAAPFTLEAQRRHGGHRQHDLVTSKLIHASYRGVAAMLMAGAVAIGQA
jgi:hypothetical protein